MADESRTLRIRCRTWDQVEAFYTEKLRGNTLVVKMPVRPQLKETVTVALGLPDGLVFAIDGVVAKVSSETVAGKVPVALRLLGLTSEVRSQLERLVGGARTGSLPLIERVRPHAPPRAADGEPVQAPVAPRLEDVPPAEQGIFTALDEERRRLLPLSAHDVLGVDASADLPTIRRAYFALTKALHPDVHARHRAPAIRQLASEVFLHVNKAYDRLRGAFAKEERAGGPALGARDGWLVVADMGRGSASIPPPPDDDDSAYASVQVFHAPPGASPDEGDEIAFTTSVRMKALTAEDLFQEQEEKQAPAPRAPVGEKPLAQTSYVEEGQTMLAAGRFREACERFAAALKVDPRNRVIRALYHVANGLDLRSRGEGTKAQEQLELALKHDPQCEEARRALAHEPEKEKRGLFKKLFDKP